VSTRWARSWLVTMLAGWYSPKETTRAPLGRAGRPLSLLIGGAFHEDGVAGVLRDELLCPVEVVRRLDGQQLDAAQGALSQPGERPRRGELDERGDAQVRQRLRAGVPADRGADLGDQPVQVVAAGLHDRTVPVGQQPRPGVGGGGPAGDL